MWRQGGERQARGTTMGCSMGGNHQGHTRRGRLRSMVRPLQTAVERLITKEVGSHGPLPGARQAKWSWEDGVEGADQLLVWAHEGRTFGNM